jgi:hypothetical protein
MLVSETLYGYTSFSRRGACRSFVLVRDPGASYMM